MEARKPLLPLIERTPFTTAIGHFLQLKEPKERACHKKNRRILRLLETFMEAAPRRYQFVDQIRFPDLVDFCLSWTGSNHSKNDDLGMMNGFFRYCYYANFTRKHLGEDLGRTMRWRDEVKPREPFLDEELQQLWDTLPALASHFRQHGKRVAAQLEAFVYILRYAGLDVATTTKLPKANVRGNNILTYRMKNGAEVWTVIPEWVAEKVWAAPHESEGYFFWSGTGKLLSARQKWFLRLRRFFNLAGLPHRTAHNFRHHFAVEHLLQGTPIEDVSRLLGHRNISVTLRSYAAWIKLRQERLEQHQRRIWESDPLHLRMSSRL